VEDEKERRKDRSERKNIDKKECYKAMTSRKQQKQQRQQKMLLNEAATTAIEYFIQQTKR